MHELHTPDEITWYGCRVGEQMAGEPTAPSVATGSTRRATRRVRRVIGVVVVALAVLAGSLLVPPARRADAMSPPQSNAYNVAGLLGYTSQPASIAAYWTQLFRSWNRSYAASRVWFYGDYFGNFNTPCGSTSIQRNNGFYCASDNTVYLDYEYMQDFIDPGGRYYLGDYAVGGFLAHEFGHGVQAWLGWSANDFRSEYAADCLAGMYTRWGYASGRLTGGDYWEFNNWLLSTPWSVTHGDPVNRTKWYRYGYDTQNINNCALAYRATA